MSTRTIIEINHDHLHDLKRYPERLVAFLRALGLTDERHLQANTPNGIRVLAQRHHTTKLTVEVE